MTFSLDDALPVLTRTPAVLRALLADLPDSWIRGTEGPNTWSPYDVVGHLIHGERHNWIPRVQHLLTLGTAEPFRPFDREAMFKDSEGKSLADLLDEFATARTHSLAALTSLNLTAADLDREGRHPAFGVVTLRQLLATWVAHDLGHTSQIVRVMARQYRDAVGPWREYLSLLRDAPANTD